MKQPDQEKAVTGLDNLSVVGEEATPPWCDERPAMLDGLARLQRVTAALSQAVTREAGGGCYYQPWSRCARRRQWP